MAIDIGGTFTDTVVLGDGERVLASSKTLTTHANPAENALLGAQLALKDAGRELRDLTGFIHGTTLATNALIEKRGAVVATITTEGFRDILEIAYERRYNQYDINIRKTDFLVSRERSLTIRERMSVHGQVLIPLDESAVGGLLRQIETTGANAVAICLLHSYANAAHELRLRELLSAARPDLVISISSEVSPEAREFDRLCTTVANAYIQPLMAGYLESFAKTFAAEGVACPILMMTAGGGMTTIRTARKFPIRLVESGPAGGAILAARVAEERGLDRVLSFDMGGTTAKLCLIDKGRPQTSRFFEIARAARFTKGSGMPVRIPVIEMIEIGAGGGSIAAVDRLGRLRVGPRSAGSEPGPAAFGRGGTEPTVTDSDVVLGYIRPETFAEGRFDLLPGKAVEVVESKVGQPLGLEVHGAAEGISSIVDESMASAGRMHAVESGKELESRTMIAFGGNGPLHACRVARSAGVANILIPANPGVGSAVGFLYAPVSFDVVRSRYSLLESLDLDAINTLFADMIREAEEVVTQGAPQADRIVTRSAFMRYNGQGHEIEIPLPDRPLTAGDIPALRSAFETAYTEQFSRPVPGMEIEILNWAASVATGAPPRSRRLPEPAPRRIMPEATREIICDVERVKRRAAFIARDDLVPGDWFAGPALVTEAQTTTFVGADFTASVDAYGNLILTRDRIGSQANG